MEIRQHLKKLLGDSMIYGISGVISSFIGVFLIPLYTKVFDPADYGIIALLASLQGIITVIIIFGMDNSFPVWYYESDKEEDRKKAASNWFFFSLSLGTLFSIILVASSSLIARYILADVRFYSLVILFAVNIFLISTQKIINTWFRIRRQPIHATVFNLVISLLNIGLNILFVLKLEKGISGIYYSMLITSTVSLISSVIILRNYISWKNIHLPELKKMIRFSLPLVPTSMIFWLMGTATPYFINFLMDDKSEIGLYQIGSNVANMMALGTFAFLQAFTAYALSISKDDNARVIYAKILEYYVYIGFACALILGILARPILQIFTNEKYLSAYVVIGILAFNVVISGMTQVVSLANLLAKNNRAVAHSAFFSVIFTIIGYFILIPIVGKEGAAISVLLGNLATCIYLALKAQKLYYIPYQFTRIIGFALTIFVIYLIYLFVV